MYSLHLSHVLLLDKYINYVYREDCCTSIYSFFAFCSFVRLMTQLTGCLSCSPRGSWDLWSHQLGMGSGRVSGRGTGHRFRVRKEEPCRLLWEQTERSREQSRSPLLSPPLLWCLLLLSSSPLLIQEFEALHHTVGCEPGLWVVVPTLDDSGAQDPHTLRTAGHKSQRSREESKRSRLVLEKRRFNNLMADLLGRETTQSSGWKAEAERVTSCFLFLYGDFYGAETNLQESMKLSVGDLSSVFTLC